MNRPEIEPPEVKAKLLIPGLEWYKGSIQSNIPKDGGRVYVSKANRSRSPQTSKAPLER